MPSLTLKINHEGKAIQVGRIEWSIGPGEVSFNVPKYTYYGETGYIEMTCLQYYDFSGFIFILEACDDNNTTLYLLEIQKVDLVQDGEYYLSKFEGGYKEFNDLARKYIEHGTT